MYFIISLFCFVLFCLVLASAEYHFDPVVYCMIPFYVMYIAFVPLHAKFALAMYRIGLRYRSLNNIIDVYAAASEFLMPFINSSLDITSFSFFWYFQQIRMAIFDQILNKLRTSSIALSEYMMLSEKFWIVYRGILSKHFFSF